jgi:hypothetical protein
LLHQRIISNRMFASGSPRKIFSKVLSALIVCLMSCDKQRMKNHEWGIKPLSCVLWRIFKLRLGARVCDPQQLRQPEDM